MDYDVTPAKARAAAMHQRYVADQAWASAGRAERKAAKFADLLAETQRGLMEAQAEAQRAEEEANRAQAYAAELDAIAETNGYAHAGVAEVTGG